MVYVKDINQPNLPTNVYSVLVSILVSISVCMTLSTVFHSINFPHNSSLFFYSVLPVLVLPY